MDIMMVDVGVEGEEEGGVDRVGPNVRSFERGFERFSK